MGHWLVDGLECDPLEWWRELVSLWGSSEFMTCLKREADGCNTKRSSEWEDDYNLVHELGLGPSNRTMDSYTSSSPVDQ